jgi:hypothetical protein
VVAFDGWHLDVVSDRHQKMSWRLDQVQEAARAAGAQHFAVIHASRSYGDLERTVADRFVLMTLEGFSDLLKHQTELEAAS